MSRADIDDFLTRLDEATATVCGACSRPLAEGGPSMYFCDDQCSSVWHRTQGEPLVGYREPWDRPLDFPGVRTERYEFREFRLPPESANLNADFRALRHAVAAATTSDQRAAAALRAESLNARRLQQQREMIEAMRPVIEEIAGRMREVWTAVSEAFQDAAASCAKAFADLQDTVIVEAPLPADPRERALTARRNRNTGPERRGRAPRTIGRPSTSARRR